MRKAIIMTFLGLCVLSWGFNLAFADRLHVEWGDCRLMKDEVVFRMQNAGPAAWSGYSVVVKVLHDQKEVATARTTTLAALSPRTSTAVHVKLAQSLSSSRFYTVQAYVFAGRKNIAMREWRLRSPESVPAFPLPGERIGLIREPETLRSAIDPINVRKLMGLF